MSALPTLFILSNNRHMGGSEKSIATLVPNLMEHARLRIFVENETHAEDLRRHEGGGLAVTMLPKGNSPRAMLAALRVLREAWHADRPRCVLANGHKGAVLLAMAKMLVEPAPAQLAVFVRDFDYYLLWPVLRALPEALFLAPSEAVFADARYRRWGLRAPRRLLALPNAVPLSTAAPPVPSGEEGFVAACGRITRWKGLHLLVRAWPQVLADCPEAQLRIVGEEVEPAYAQELRHLVSALDLEASVKFLPFQSDLAPIFKQGALFVIPSLSERPGPETFSRIIIEAWAHAKPVVAFACGGPRYLIEDGVDGLLIKEADVEALARGIVALLRDPRRRIAMGQHGAAKARTLFDPATIAARLAQELLAEKPNHRAPLAEVSTA